MRQEIDGNSQIDGDMLFSYILIILSDNFLKYLIHNNLS